MPVVGRLEAVLLDQRVAGEAKDLGRVRPAACAVQRRHPLLPEALSGRMSRGENLELADQLGVLPQCQPRVHEALRACNGTPFQAPTLGREGRQVHELGVRLTPPQRQGLRQRPFRVLPAAASHRCPALLHEGLEHRGVQAGLVDREPVARRRRHDQVAACRPAVLAVPAVPNRPGRECGSEPGHVRANRSLGIRRGGAGPQCLGQCRHAHGAAGVERQPRQHRPPMRPADMDPPVIGSDLERAEDPDGHPPIPT